MNRFRRSDFSRVLLCGAGWLGLAVLTGAASTPVEPGVVQFKPFVAKGIAASLVSAKTMRDRIAAHDLAGAQKAWLGARAGWEQAEVIAPEFLPELDAAIDSWPNGEAGFHGVEARLFGAHQADAQAQADALVQNLTEFDRRFKDLAITPQRLFDGMVKLAYRLGENRADGGEAPYAGTSIADLSANLDGLRAAYRLVFADRLKAKAPALAAAAEKDIGHAAEILKAPDLKSLDADALLDATEDLAATLQAAAPALGLEKPNLGD